MTAKASEGSASREDRCWTPGLLKNPHDLTLRRFRCQSPQTSRDAEVRAGQGSAEIAASRWGTPSVCLPGVNPEPEPRGRRPESPPGLWASTVVWLKAQLAAEWRLCDRTPVHLCLDALLNSVPALPDASRAGAEHWGGESVQVRVRRRLLLASPSSWESAEVLRAGEKGLSQREKLKYLMTLHQELPRLKTEATGVSQSPGRGWGLGCPGRGHGRPEGLTVWTAGRRTWQERASQAPGSGSSEQRVRLWAVKRLQTSDPPRVERRRGPDLTQRAPRGPREPQVGSAACASAVPEGPASERRWPADPGPRRLPDPKPRELWHLWGSCYRGTCTFKLSCMPCIVSQSGNKDFIKTQRPCGQEAGRRRSHEVCFPPPLPPISRGGLAVHP